MKKLRQILVPVDFSPASMVALDQAATLARHDHAAVDMLHVWDLPALEKQEDATEYIGLPHSAIDSVSVYAKEALDTFTNQARSNGIEIRNARVMSGKAYRTIVEEAERGGYDLIVLGTHGRRKLARALLGSVAELVVRHARCPVLVARPRPGAADASPAAP